MAILQGTPVNISGIHPFVALMAQGQQGISEGIRLAGQSIRDINSNANQVIRDGVTTAMELKRQDIDKKKFEHQQQMDAQRMSLEEKRLAQQESQFQRTLDSRAKERAASRAMQSRQLDLQNLRYQGELRKQQREERYAQQIDSIFGGMTFGQPPTTNPTVPIADPTAELANINPLAESVGFSGAFATPSLDITDIAPPPQAVAAPAIDPMEAQRQQILNVQRAGLMMAARNNPTNAGYAIQSLAKLEMSEWERKQAGAAGGLGSLGAPVQPFQSLGATPEEANAKFAEMSPTIKTGLIGSDVEWDSVVSNPNTPREDLIRSRGAMENELFNLQRQYASKRFQAASVNKTAGGQLIDSLQESDPIISKLQRRIEQANNVIDDDLKNFAGKPPRQQVQAADALADNFLAKTEQTDLLAQNVYDLWGTNDKPGLNQLLTDPKLKGKVARGPEVMVGQWKVRKFSYDTDKLKDLDTRARLESWNKLLDNYSKANSERKDLDRQTNVALRHIERNNLLPDAEAIKRRLGRSQPPASNTPQNFENEEEAMLNARDRRDFEEAQGLPITPSPFLDNPETKAPQKQFYIPPSLFDR